MWQYWAIDRLVLFVSTMCFNVGKTHMHLQQWRARKCAPIAFNGKYVLNRKGLDVRGGAIFRVHSNSVMIV